MKLRSCFRRSFKLAGRAALQFGTWRVRVVRAGETPALRKAKASSSLARRFRRGLIAAQYPHPAQLDPASATRGRLRRTQWRSRARATRTDFVRASVHLRLRDAAAWRSSRGQSARADHRRCVPIAVASVLRARANRATPRALPPSRSAAAFALRRVRARRANPPNGAPAADETPPPVRANQMKRRVRSKASIAGAPLLIAPAKNPPANS